jgi:hypothetical protein
MAESSIFTTLNLGSIYYPEVVLCTYMGNFNYIELPKNSLLC